MIRMELPLLPPSVNDMYMTVRAGKKTMRAVTPAGKKFKKESEAYLAKHYPLQLARLKKNRPYGLFLRFEFQGLVNKGWANRTTDRYKRFDVTNRVKVIEDTLVNVSAVDDSHFMLVTCEKVQGPVERTTIFIWNQEEERSLLDDASLSLL